MINSQSHESMLALYQKLTESERLIVQFCALLDTNNHGSSLIPYLKPIKSSKPLTDVMVKSLKRTDIINNECRCHKSIRHQVMLDALANPQAVKLIEGAQKFFHIHHSSDTEYLLRLSIYVNDEKSFNAIIARIQTYNALSIEKYIQRLFANQILEVIWLKSRIAPIQKYILAAKLAKFWVLGETNKNATQWLPYYQKMPVDKVHLPYQSLLTTHDIYTAHFKNAQLRLNFSEKTALDFANSATLAFLQEQHETALQDFTVALKLLRKEQQKRKVFLQGINGLIYLLAHIRLGTSAALFPLIELANSAAQDDYPQLHQQGFAALYAWLNILRGETRVAETILIKLQDVQDKLDPVSFVMFAFVQYWQDKTKLKFSALMEHFLRVKDTLPLVAILLTEIIENIKPNSSEGYAEQHEPVCKILPIFNTIPYSDVVLSHLEDFLKNKSTSIVDMDKRRVVWLIDPDKKTLYARIQTRNPKGAWNLGKRIPWAQLENYKSYPELVKLLQAEDKKIISAIKFKEHPGHQDHFSALDPIWLTLVDHPHLFHMDNPRLAVELTVQKPELMVEETEEGYHLQLSHQSDTTGVLFEKEMANRYRLIDFTEEYLRLQTTLGGSTCVIPHDKKSRLLSLIQQNDKLGIHAALMAADLPTMTADSTLYVILMPWHQGLKINLLVKPAGETGDYYQPGKGKVLIINRDLQQRYKRDLIKEQTLANQLINACATLTNIHSYNYEWFLAETENCLEILDELQQYIAKQDLHHNIIKLEWPEGEAFKVSRALSFNNLSLQVSQWQQWFEIKGELAIDEKQVINLQTLLKNIAETPGRFIALGDKQFLALTQHFKKRLQELALFTQHDNQKILFHSLAAPALETVFADAIHLHADKHWLELLKRLQTLNQHHPTVPAYLKADLRDYQLEGYMWLSRLAYWGVGACLADDMGLGKTLQSLVLALEHADKGPILIVAPTSVCYNWQLEIQRFTPTLNIKFFDVEDKSSLIDNLKPRDILVCSYHYLQQDIKKLNRITWQVAILDEGQAIKNFSTKRAQAAFQLKATTRIILSGTPIENRLSELWSLFRFLNPGLLGSREAFQNRFINPIERDNDETARAALKRLVQPFILRRNKTDVLKELPSRTDQTLYIDPTPAEITFYEALRRQALSNIEDLKDAPAGRRQLHILSEITRLKRACCHPTLVVANSELASSKVTQFLEIIEELRANHHRALVFSQYVSFLQKIRNELDSRDITYQYLDGQTPVTKRQTSIADFQNGKGELFLISLKAGGMGLNLTAADYVIHLDPWWNPAVEDQASDRAHRIGQTKPVTIYRLIVRNTIEEKILQMHANKRNLANELLSGSDKVSKLTEEELLQLIKT